MQSIIVYVDYKVNIDQIKTGKFSIHIRHLVVNPARGVFLYLLEEALNKEAMMED
jgi:hypothetical protein